ncbi:microtubule-associated protein futsch-like [Daphnia carinata]|uniref:microtubule-associated protein futsch-like n=1 Tax=Daphnia carinata TaxID=120202 RepID=UPI0025797962|nr:microtubule-associated protein futsch-like [Daphnia carinata]
MADETSSASSAFSPLSGGYLLIVLSEPHSEQHKQVLLEHLAKGLASWDVVGTQIDIESELRNIAAQCPHGEEVRNGEKLIQLASDSLVTEILIHPQLSTLKQCMRNLLASFTRHRHVIHAGYTLSGPGSWILQDGTYEFSDFMNIVRDAEVQRLYRAYESSITMDLHCADEGQWSAEQINQEPAIKAAKISINPAGRLSATDSQGMQDAVNSFIRYISDVLPSVTLDHLLEPSDVVGNIRFSHPTLYVFPGGQGDSALFGISGFNILVDGGFGRKPCFWDFTRHLDRLDAVVMTRMNASSLSGLTGAICRKASSPVYPQVGHIFCNLPRDSEIGLGDIEQQLNAADSSSESLNVNINDLCRAMSAGLGALQLKAQPIYRSATLEPINLYHKVGHGTLDMFIISPSANSPEVKELMRLWRSGEVATALRTVKMGGKEFSLPLLDIVSVCALLVWQPADPNEPVTRLLFPGSAPQHKILEGLEKFKQLEFLKSPVFMAKDVAAPPSAVITPSSTSSAFTKSPVKAKTSSPRHTPIEPVVVKAAPVRKEASKPPAKSADHSSSNTKEADVKSATPRPATKIIKSDVLSSSSRTGSTELRAKKPEAKPAPIKSATTTAKKDGPTGLSNGETNKALAPKIKKDVANMKMVEARVHSFKSPASLKRAEENKTKKPLPSADAETKEKTAAQRSQSQSREKRSASGVRAQPADEDKPRVKLVKKIAPSTSETTPVSPAKPAKPIKAKAKELPAKPIEPKAPVTKDVKKDKPTPATPKPKPMAAKETSSKPAPKASAPSQTSTPTPSGKAVKRPVKPAAAAAAAAAAVGAAAAVVAVAAAVASEEQAPTADEQPAVVEESFSAAEAPQAASSPKGVEATGHDQVVDEASLMDAIESQIVEDVEATEEQSHHESEQESQSVNLEDEAETEDKEEAETEDKDEEVADGSTGGEVVDAEEAEVIEKEEDAEAHDEDEAASEETEVVEAAVAEDVAETEEAKVAETEEAKVAETEEAKVAETEEAKVAETEEAKVAETDGAEVAETEEAEVAETEEAEVAETEEAEVAETEEAEVAETEEAEVAETEEAEVAETEEAEVAETEEAEVAETEEAEVAETEEAEVAETEEAEVAETEEAEVAETEEPEVAAEEAEVAEAEEAEVAETVEAEVAETVEAEVAQTPHEETAATQVNEKTHDKEEMMRDTAEIQQTDEPEGGNADEDLQEADVNERQARDDVVHVEVASEPEIKVGRSIDDEIVAADVAQIDRSDDQDVNLETDECQEPVEEESQLAVSSKSVDAGRPSASPQPVPSEDETASREVQVDDVIDQIEQSQDVQCAHPTSQLEEENIKDEIDEPEKEKEEELSSQIHHEDVSSEAVEEEIQQAVAATPIEASKPTASPQPEILDSDKKVEAQEVSAHEEVHTTESTHEESSLDYEKKDEIPCQVVGNGDSHALDTTEHVEDAISGQVDDDVHHEDVDSHDIEKRQVHELTVEAHQDDAVSSLSSASDLEPTPVLDRSGASLYEEEQHLSSMESQPESHQFTQKSAPQMVEETPKDSKQTAKSPVVQDEPVEEVEEEFKAEIVVRPVPVVDPSDLDDVVAPQQPTPTPPVVKSPVKEIPSALVLDQEEDEGEEVEEEFFQKEVKAKDCAVPITPTEEGHAFGYSEPQRQSEDRQLSSSIPTSSDATGKQEESTTDGAVSLSRAKEAQADEFRATIDNQYAGFMNVETSFKDADEKPKAKTPEEKCLTETVAEQPKQVEDKPLAEQKLPEEKPASSIDLKEDHFVAVEEKKQEQVVATKSTSNIESVGKADETHEEVVEEVVCKAVDNKSVKAEKYEESNVKEIIKSEMKSMDESEILKNVEDLITEKVDIPSTHDKPVKVSDEPEEVCEHFDERSQALDIESTPPTKEIESSKSQETFVVEDVKSFVEDVHALVEEIQLPKMEVKSVESEKKEVLLEELKVEKPTIAANIELTPTDDVQTDDLKDFAKDVVVESLDIKSTKSESTTPEKEQISQVTEEVSAFKVADILEKVKSPVEEMFKKVSAVAVSKFTEKCDAEAISEKAVELPKVDEKEQNIVEEIIEKTSVLEVSKTPEKVENIVEDVVEKASAISVSVDASKVAEKGVVEEIVEKVVDLPKMAESLVEDIVEKANSVQVAKTPEKEVNLVKETIETATPKSCESTADETESFSKVAEKLDDIESIVFEKYEKHGKTDKDNMSTIDEPIQHATAETAVFSAEGKSQRSSTSEATPLELEPEISERKLSDISASSFGQLEKEEAVEETLLKTEANVTLAGKSTKEEVVVDPTFVAPLTASSPIDGPELLKELSFPLGLVAKANVLIKDKLEQVGEFIKEIKDTSVELASKSNETKPTEVKEIKDTSVELASKCQTDDSNETKPTEVKEIKDTSVELASKCQTDDSNETKPTEVKEIIQDSKDVSVELTSKCQTDFTHDTKTEVKEIIQDVKVTSVESTSKSEVESSCEIKTEEVKEIIQNVKDLSIELTSKSTVESSYETKTEEVKETIQITKDVSVECALKSETEVKETVQITKDVSVESASKSETEVKETVQITKDVSVDLASKSDLEVKETVQITKDVSIELASKSDVDVKETVQITKEVSVELTSKSDIDLSHKTTVEEVTEIIQEIECVTLQLAEKSESDCSFTSKMVEVKEEIQEIKKTSIELASESKMEVSNEIQEEVKEIIQDVKKAAVELSSKSEVDCAPKSKVEEICETIQEVRELTSTMSTMPEKLEAKPDTHVEVKTVHTEPEVIPQATFQLKCDPLANLPVVELAAPSKTVSEELEKPKSSDLAKLEIVEKTEQLKPDVMDYATVSGSSSTSVTPKTPLSPNLARREVVESKVSPSVQMAATLESFAAPPTRFEDEISSQPSSLDSVEVHSTSSATWAATEKHQEEDEDVGSLSLTPTINYLAAGYEGVNISTSSKLSTIASSDGEAEAAQPLSLDSNWSSKTFDKLTSAANSSTLHRPEESAFSSGPSSWDEREPNTRPYCVVSESISDRSATSSIISHVTDDDYPIEKHDRPSLDSHLEPRTSSELSSKKELGVLPASPVPSSPFSTDRCSSHGDFEANKDSLSSIQTSESSDFHLETKVDDSHSAISSTRSDYSDDRSGSSIDPSLLQQQRLEQRSLTPRSDISCSSDATDPITTAHTITTELIQPGQQQTSVEMKASSKAELADPKLAPHNIWLKEKDTASSPNPFTDQYVDDDTDHPVTVEHASSALYYPQQKQQPHQQQHLSDFESDRHSDSQSSSVPVAEYTDEYYAQHLEFVEASHKSSQPHTDEVSDQEAYLYESEHDDHDQHYHPYATKYSDSYDEADLYPTEEAINDDYRHVGDHQNGNAYHYYEGSEQDSIEANVVGHPPHQYEDQNRNDRTPTRDVQHSYVAADVYDTEPAVHSPTSRQSDVAAPMTASSSRDERVVPQASPLPSPQPQQSPQSTQQQHEDTLASWGKPLGLPAPVAPVVFSSNGTNGSPLKRPTTASNNANKSAEKATNGTNAMMGAAPFYVDLAYIPHHSDPRYSDVDFFRRVRARHYVLSTLEPSAQVLDALLEGKQSWTGDDKDLDVTIIPTYDSDALAVWVSANEDLLARNRIDLAPSASRCTINLQDHETSCSAYRLEF